MKQVEKGSDVKGGLQVAEENAHVGITVVRIALEAFEEGLFKGGRDVRIDFARGNKIEGAIQLFPEDFLRAVTRKGFAPGQEFEGGNSVGEDIDAMIDRFMPDLFGRHVGWRSRIPGHLPWFVRFGPREIEVHETQVSVAREDDIFRFEVQVHEPAFVHMFEGERHVDEDIADLIGEHGIVAGAEEFQVGALDIFHEEEEIALDFAMGDVGDDVFVIMDPGQDFTATNEASLGHEIEAEIVVEATESVGISLGVGGQPDIGHPAAADEFLQVIGAELSGLGQFCCVASDVSEECHDNWLPGVI
jgi:hypothetical protein